MRFSTFFMTAVAVSMPVAALNGPHKDTENPLLTRDELGLGPRQDLTTALGDLVDLLKSLSGILTPEFFDDTQITVHGLADLLVDPFANQTRGLVGFAVDTVDQIKPLLSTILDLDLEGLVNSVSKLLTPNNIDTIGNLLGKANTLLTDDFIKQTQGLISDAAPLISAISEFVTALISALLRGDKGTGNSGQGGSEPGYDEVVDPESISSNSGSGSRGSDANSASGWGTPNGGTTTLTSMSSGSLLDSPISALIGATSLCYFAVFLSNGAVFVGWSHDQRVNT
ncbi:hypothetical protein F5X99DRAFT_424517 [Biscogniauxia marginata]|nr:hypothetical protein F5X99DRAFT_424517 [Biscogniauxia marginata]